MVFAESAQQQRAAFAGKIDIKSEVSVESPFAEVESTETVRLLVAQTILHPFLTLAPHYVRRMYIRIGDIRRNSYGWCGVKVPISLENVSHFSSQENVNQHTHTDAARKSPSLLTNGEMGVCGCGYFSYILFVMLFTVFHALFAGFTRSLSVFFVNSFSFTFLRFYMLIFV